MAITETRAEEIVLDGVPFPLAGPLRVVNLATFVGRVTIGDPSKGDDMLLSTKVWSDFSGGMGVETEQEGVDNNRFWYGDAETIFPNKLSLPLDGDSINPGGVDFPTYPLVDFDGTGALKLYVAVNTGLVSYDVNYNETSHGALTDAPVNKGVVFKGTGATKKLFIPQGNQGYQTWDGASIAAQSTAVLPIAFCEWDGKLFSLGSDGILAENTDGSTTWTTKATLDASLEPKGLVAFFNRADEPTLHLVTDRDVWAYDASIPKLYRTHLQYPPHPDQGLASAEWRGDLYVSVGLGIHRYTGATISAMGPDGRDGVVAAHRGKIVDLVPEYNGLNAIVDKDTATVFTTVLQWTGVGWHTRRLLSGNRPTWGLISTVGDKYRLVVGNRTQGLFTSIDLRRGFYNPQQGAAEDLDEFENAADLYTAWFDAGMKGFVKAASHLTFNVERMPTGHDIDVYYQTDFGNEVLLGTVNASGETVLTFGTNATGIAFDRIRIHLAIFNNNGDNADTAIVDSFVLHFVKIPHQAFAWTATIPLPSEGGYKGKSSEELAAKLDALLVATNPPFFSMVHRDTSYRVRLSQVTGEDHTGLDFGGARLVSILQIPQT